MTRLEENDMGYNRTPRYTVDQEPVNRLRRSPDGRYSVRLYDMFDGWLDLKSDLTWKEAVERWLKKTKGGVSKICYGDGDYYDIFPSNTHMLHTPEYRGR